LLGDCSQHSPLGDASTEKELVAVA
jgi:hypothetical protein